MRISASDSRQLISDLDETLNVYQVARDRASLLDKQLGLLMGARIRRLEWLRAMLVEVGAERSNRSRGRRERG